MHIQDVESDGISEASLQERADVVAALLRGADALTAAATELLAGGGIEAVAGRPVEHMLRTDAGSTRTDASMLVQAASMLDRMPALRESFDEGLVSWGQVRSIIVALRRAESTGRRNTLIVEVLDGNDAGAAAGGAAVSRTDSVAGTSNGGVA